MKASALLCENCGAGLPPPVRFVSTCTYCGMTHHVGAPIEYVPRAEVRAWTQHGDLHSELAAREDLSLVGVGVRHDARAHPDPFALDRAVFATHAAASSTYGGGWSPDALIGPPTVFPAHGDRAGTWAPLLRSTRMEWIEVSFAHPVAANALRIYETNEAGGVYAVVVLDDEGETLAYRAPPEPPRGEARLLEVLLDRPRVVRRARVYLANDRGRSWTEIDAVALIAAEPLPEHMRAKMPSPAGCMPGVLFVAIAAVALALVIAVGALSSSRSPSASASAGLDIPPTRLGLAAPIASNTIPSPGIVWASTLVAYSTEYASEQNGAQQALGAPNVFPVFQDLPAAWAPRERDAGMQWITVALPAPTDSRGIVWLETLGPGTVARIDDLTDEGAPVTLWEGTVAVPPQVATAYTLTLPTPRRVQTIRIVLDTNRVAGWNEIDAIGVLPAR